MTRLNLTDITLVLDRSGSMQSIKQATIEAFNSFLASQKSGAGEAQMTLVQFDDQYELVYGAVPLARAPKLTEATYLPRASTALLDAMGRTILATGKRLNQLPEAQRPGTVVFVTLTDGFENASTEYTHSRVNDMIREQRDKYSWQFIFLGANQDAIATAAQLGVAAGQAMTFAANTVGVQACIGAFSDKLNVMRAARHRGKADAIVEFDTADRDAAMED